MFAIFAPNPPEWVVAFQAVASIGGVVTPINSLFNADDLKYQLKDSGAGFLLSAPAFIGRAIDAAESTGIEEVFVVAVAEGATPSPPFSPRKSTYLKLPPIPRKT